MTALTDTAATETALPAEKLTPGVAMQTVNVFDRDGNFDRPYRDKGTVIQVRAKGAIGWYHHTQPEWHMLRDIALNPAFPGDREAMFVHLETCPTCQCDPGESWREFLAGDTDLEVADHIWSAHQFAKTPIE